ncbi:unnamed protein product [Danaus chrysippus]|uniref:(African queen) hypothetical protein n=1 Tax=Danaus chrysippus TaxID=151541 RepID=A0A8J2VT57_9NEOP|nr:unnamed protein product [Danaus chrysippus]
MSQPPSPPLELSDTSIIADELAYPRTSRSCCDRGQKQILRGVSILDGKIKKEPDHVSNSASVSDSEARARSLEESLEAAMRVLKNKEETVRVQAESLALAEERLATLGQERKEMVQTLQDNLSVIEELYRECFYETARQDEIIALLRNTCRGHSRVMETRKQREKDLALEVENLKVEISNYLNSSTNNDSGVWETGGGEGRAGEGEGPDDLRGVLEQLQRLWDVLQVRTREWEWVESE